MKILQFILLLISSSCFLVYEKYPQNSYSGKVIKEFKNIVNLHTIEKMEFPEYQYQKDSITYSLSNVKGKNVFFNEYMPFSFSTEPSTFSIILNWKPPEGQSSYISPYHSIYRASLAKNSKFLGATLYDIEFIVEVSNFEFTKSWTKKEDVYVPSGKVNNGYISFKANCLDEKCPFDSNIILEIVNAFLKDKTNDMNECLTNKGANEYYSKLPSDEQNLYTQTATSITNENHLDLNLESNIELSPNQNIIIKRKGKLNEEIIEESPLLEDTSTSQEFLINMKMIHKLVSTNLFDIVYEQATNPSKLYQLTIGCIKQVVDIEGYDDSSEVKVYVNINDTTFNTDDKTTGTALIKVNIYSREDLEIVFPFEVKISFKLTPTLFQNGLNFVLLCKDLKIVDITSTYEIKDKELLSSWIENTYLVALGKSEFNILSNALDLSNYFTTNKLGYELKDDYLSIVKK